MCMCIHIKYCQDLVFYKKRMVYLKNSLSVKMSFELIEFYEDTAPQTLLQYIMCG